jgi:hypothetical protein
MLPKRNFGKKREGRRRTVKVRAGRMRGNGGGMATPAPER